MGQKRPPPPAYLPGRYDAKMKGDDALDSKRGGGGPPIEDLHDGGQISKNDDYEICLEFYSGYGKIEISAIWQKFLPLPDIAIFDQIP